MLATYFPKPSQIQKFFALLNNDTVNKTHTFWEQWLYYTGHFCTLWKNNGYCIAFYYGFICFVLKDTFKNLMEMSLINRMRSDILVKIYNETVDITKNVNEIFHAMIFVTVVETLIRVFKEAYSIIFMGTGILWTRSIRVTFDYSRILVICFSASMVTNAALEAKYEIRKMMTRLPFESRETFTMLYDFFPGLTILDSIVIDRSFVLTVSGILVTYGILIATFNNGSNSA
jgi:hypothetical protein